MTAVSLFDALARGIPGGPTRDAGSAGLVRLAEELAEQSLADLRRLQEYEREFGSPDLSSESALDVLTSVYRLYEQWSGEAQQVLWRLRDLARAGHALAASESLEDACARVRARLSLTPEQVARAIQQARRGNLVPGEVVRNELRAGLHR